MSADLVELTLPIAFLRSLAVQELGTEHPVAQLLAEAILEPEAGLSRPQRESHRRWVKKAVLHVVGEYVDDNKSKAVYAVLLWLQELLAQDKLTLVEGSIADRAIAALQETLGDVPDAVFNSATKQSRKIAQRVAELGYFA